MSRNDQSSASPVLVIISGPPGAGKSSTGREIAGEFGLALLSKDMFKEGIYDHLPGVDTSDSHRLGIAAIGMMYDFARAQLENGIGVVLESTFDRGKAEKDIRPLLEMARTVIVHVSAPKDQLVERFERRADSANRHEVHQDESRVEDLEEDLVEGVYEPMDVDAPLIEVNLDEPGEVDTESLIIRIRTILGGGEA